MQRHLHHAQADQHTLCLDGHGGAEDQGIAIDCLAGEMVLGNPNGVEPKLFDQFSLV
jgi:hypothetical protein